MTRGTRLELTECVIDEFEKRFVVNHGVDDESTTVEMPLSFYRDIRRQLREAISRIDQLEKDIS
jgi:hypothetical protein